jgi:hypothetical protein
MADLKTKATQGSVKQFIDSIDDESRRSDCRKVARLMRRVTGKAPKMWGASMVGFGTYHYKYASGREGDWFLTGFSPRKQALTLYIMAGFDGYEALMANLGKFKTGKSCLYVKRLEDIDMAVLERLVERSVRHMKETYG